MELAFKTFKAALLAHLCTPRSSLELASREVLPIQLAMSSLSPRGASR